jgi:hypothetical protein
MAWCSIKKAAQGQLYLYNDKNSRDITVLREKILEFQ